jgi:hypothetical protein
MNPFQLLNLASFSSNCFMSIQRNAEVIAASQAAARSSQLSSLAAALQTLPILGNVFQTVSRWLPVKATQPFSDSLTFADGGLNSYPLSTDNPFSYLPYDDILRRIARIGQNPLITGPVNIFLDNWFPIIDIAAKAFQTFLLWAILVSILNFFYFNRNYTPFRLLTKGRGTPTTRPVIFALACYSNRLIMYLPLVPFAPSFRVNIKLNYFTAIFLSLFLTVCFFGLEYCCLLVFSTIHNTHVLDLQMGIANQLVSRGIPIDLSQLSSLGQPTGMIRQVTGNIFKAMGFAVLWSFKRFFGSGGDTRPVQPQIQTRPTPSVQIPTPSVQPQETEPLIQDNPFAYNPFASPGSDNLSDSGSDRE